MSIKAGIEHILSPTFSHLKSIIAIHCKENPAWQKYTMSLRAAIVMVRTRAIHPYHCRQWEIDDIKALLTLKPISTLLLHVCICIK